MTRSHYYFAVFFITLGIAATAFQYIIQFQSGNQIFTFPSYFSWFVFNVSVNFIGALPTLKYYRYKQYRPAFWSGIILMIVSAFQSNVVFNILYFNALWNWNIPSYLTLLGTALVYSGILIFSKVNERKWLKAAGILTAILGLILIVTLIWDLNSHNFQLKANLQKVHQWTSWLSILVPVLFILNFSEELKTKPKTDDKELKTRLKYTMILTGIVALVFGLLLGNELVREYRATVSTAIINEKTRAIASRFEARKYLTSRGDTLRYRFMKPFDYDPGKKYPLVVCLHHGGAHGADNIRQVEGSEAPMLSNYQNRRDYPAFIFVPQCGQGVSWADPETDFSVFEAISVLGKEFSIDEKRRYVTGVSGGGYGSWHFICSRPEMFAAAIPICGSGDTDLAKNIVNVAVWAFHGEDDNLAPVEGSRNMITAIKKAGGQPRYTEFAGEGHNIAQFVESTPGLLDWLFEQKRR